jgi:hypothetical protein
MTQNILAVSVLRKTAVTAHVIRPRSRAWATRPTNGAPRSAARLTVRLSANPVETRIPR